MFNREDYWPYIVGMMVFAGLIGVPAIYSAFILPLMDEPFASLPRQQVLWSSLIATAIFAFSHTRDGGVSLGRLLGGMVIALLLFIRAQGASLFLRENIIFLPSGILGLILMSAGGWLGIWLARWLGISQHLVPKDPSALQALGETQDAAAAVEPEQSATPDYQFTQDVYNALLERTRQAWLAGTYETWQPGLRDATIAKPESEFYKLVNPAFEAISIAFAKTPPLDDEVIVCAEDGGQSVSTVVTNHRFFFFETDENRLKDHHANGVVTLDNIVSCEITDKFLAKEATLQLRDGSTLEVTGLLTVRAPSCIYARLHPVAVVDATDSQESSAQEPAVKKQKFMDPANVLVQMKDGSALPSPEEFIRMSEDDEYPDKFVEHLAFGTNKQEQADYLALRDRLPREFTDKIAEQMAITHSDGVSNGLRTFGVVGIAATAGALYFTFTDFRWYWLLIAVLGILPALSWRYTSMTEKLLKELQQT